MYREMIRADIEELFEELRGNVKKAISAVGTIQEVSDRVVKYIAKVMTNRSEEILYDMLMELQKEVLDRPEFSSVESQLALRRADLYDEIKGKYNFEVEENINYEEADKMLHYFIEPLGAGVLAGAAAAGGIKLGKILGLALSRTYPAVPVSAAIIGCLGTFLAEMLWNEPRCSRKKFVEAVDGYLTDIQRQFCMWLDEVEKYYYKRVGEISALVQGESEDE